MGNFIIIITFVSLISFFNNLLYYNYFITNFFNLIHLLLEMIIAQSKTLSLLNEVNLLANCFLGEVIFKAIGIVL